MTIDEAVSNIQQPLSDAATGFKQLQVAMLLLSSLMVIAIILISVDLSKNK